MQVAEKYMPKGGLIVGVDLDPIKPIPHCISFVSDITTPQCRATLRGHLKHFEADLVLHDGAPNVGTAWVQDAFTQSELVLQSLKLATEFLRKGGSFVTKVFRSGDYNSLMWVFNQLFGKVEATKPPSSRNVSAEIFVVCQDFLKPKYIDPKFLDPRHVFKELSTAAAASSAAAAAIIAQNGDGTTALTNSGATQTLQGMDIFQPDKKKRNRTGYAEGDYTLFKELPVRMFIECGSALDAISILSTCNKLVFDKNEEDEQKWLESRHTTEDILMDMKDLKVLGKGEFKRLIKWRLAIRLEVGLDVKKTDAEDKVDIEDMEEPVDTEEQITEEVGHFFFSSRHFDKLSNFEPIADLSQFRLSPR